MFSRRVPLPILLVFAAWLVAFPTVRALLSYAGAWSWVSWSIFAVGLASILAWLLLWLRRTAAPLRAQLEQGRQAHPDAVVELVALEGSTIALLVANRDGLTLESLLRAAAADIESVSVTHVSPRLKAVVVALPSSRWTFPVVGTSTGSMAGGRVVDETADRIASALGAPRS